MSKLFVHVRDLLTKASYLRLALEGFTESTTREMPPEWNIKAVIIQPGGFNTQWGKSSLEVIPPHPLYAHPTSPSSLFRQMMAGVTAGGEPAKAAQAMMKVASLPDPPMRIQLGTESLIMVRKKAQKTIDDTFEYEEIGHSTNGDGVDKNWVMNLMKDLKI